MKKLLISVLLLAGVTAMDLPVMAQSASTPVCSGDQPIGYASCHAAISNLASPNVPTGYGPQQFRTAYQLPSQASNPTTIAIVDAFDNPTVESDLNTYSSTFGLPACTTANGCFTKVNQSGQQGNYPGQNGNWSLEIALDVEIAHAICPNCKILLVEANDNQYINLGQSVNQAVTMGATIVSNSYGGYEFPAEIQYDYFYNHPGVTIVASSGDYGYGVQYPAASPYVVAVGGTTLALNSDYTRQVETVWSGTGSGCSQYESKPAWQVDTLCGKRTVVDVAADADPSTGAAIYYNGGWTTVGGTSLAAPLISGIYALAGNSTGQKGGFHLYGKTSKVWMNRVTSGNNGGCNSNYLCDASYSSSQYGYNGPTAFGTPNGSNGFK